MVTKAKQEYESDFEEWYKYYPRKVSKFAASKAYSNARGEVSREELLDSLLAQVQSGAYKGRDMKHIPHPATWISQKRWTDTVQNTLTFTDDRSAFSEGARLILEMAEAESDERIKRTMVALAKLFSARLVLKETPTKDMIYLYADSLKSFSTPVLVEAVDKIIKEDQYFPTPSRVRSISNDVSEQMKLRQSKEVKLLPGSTELVRSDEEISEAKDNIKKINKIVQDAIRKRSMENLLV